MIGGVRHEAVSPVAKSCKSRPGAAFLEVWIGPVEEAERMTATAGAWIAILSLQIPPQLSFKLRGNLVDPKQDTSVPS
jgi:hypothetical protein